MADVHDVGPETAAEIGPDNAAEIGPDNAAKIGPEAEPEEAALPAAVPRREPAPRRGRCANHPGEAQVATCDACGRPLCLACAVPVRGSVVGPECVAEVVPEVPDAPVPPGPSPRGRTMAAAGFLITLVASLFPWARYGDASGALQAWAPHWSLLAVAASLAGLVVWFVFRRRRGDRLVEATALFVLAGTSTVGALLHGLHPPALSAASPVGWGFGLAGALLALGGAGLNLGRVLGGDA